MHTFDVPSQQHISMSSIHKASPNMKLFHNHLIAYYWRTTKMCSTLCLCCVVRLKASSRILSNHLPSCSRLKSWQNEMGYPPAGLTDELIAYVVLLVLVLYLSLGKWTLDDKKISVFSKYVAISRFILCISLM